MNANKKDNGEIIEMATNYSRIGIIYNDSTDDGEFGEIYKC